MQEHTKDHADGSPARGPTKAHHSAGLYPNPVDTVVDSTVQSTAEAATPIELEPIELSAQAGSRSANNSRALGEYPMAGYTAVDEAAFFANPDVFVVADGVELPTDLIGYRWSQAALPDDATVDAIAQAMGIDLPVVRYDDLPNQPGFDPPDGFVYWNVFDTSTGGGLQVQRTGVGGVLPVEFDFRGPATIVDGFYGEIGDAGPLCEFTDIPDPSLVRSCEGDYAVEVDAVTLPSVEEAEAIAARIVNAAAGVDDLVFTTTVTEERPYPSVVVAVKPASPTVPLSWYFSFGADGELALARGNVGTFDEIHDISVVDRATAVARLNDPEYRWLAPAGLDSADAPRSTEPSGRTIEIVAVEAALWSGMSPAPYQNANYGLVYYVPAYAFVDADGNRYVVPAVPDDLLVEPDDG